MRIFFLAAAFVIFLASCVTPAEYWRRATEPPYPGGGAPAKTVADKVPDLVDDPGDFDAWLEIAKALGYVVLGAGGKAGVDKLRKRPS